MKFNTLAFEKPVEGLGLIYMDRPACLNAMNLEMLDDFSRLFDEVTQDESVRVLVITGRGRGFSSGADLGDAVSHRDSEYFSDPGTFLRLVQEPYSRLIAQVRRLPQPVIAAVNGPAAGGGFCLALACDVRIASPEAFFVASFINLGLSGGELGTSYLLPRLVGLSRASDILLSGRKVSADEAESMGLVSRVVEGDMLMEAAIECAGPMLQKSRESLRLTREALNLNVDAVSLEAAMDLENRNQSILVFSRRFFSMVQGFMKKEKE